MKNAIVSRIYFWGLWLCTKVFTRVTITGWENVPAPADGGLLIVSNHFTVFEIPFIGTYLPKAPGFFATRELLNTGWLAPGILSYGDRVILTDRGKVDRQSLMAGLNQLEKGEWLSIFPEGGITREVVTVSHNGESTAHLPFIWTREEPVELFKARSGSAWLAVQSGVAVLPIAFEGTEKLEAELLGWRRTQIKMHIGKPIGPFVIPAGVRGKEKKKLIDQFGHEMMQAVADILPEKYRGEHYR